MANRNKAIGYKDSSGNYGFVMYASGSIKIGNDGTDVIAMTGSTEIVGDISATGTASFGEIYKNSSTNNPVFGAGDYYTWYSSYGAPTLQNPHLTNTLYLANTRFAFDANVSNAHKLFNGEYNEGAISAIASGSTTSVFTLNLTSSGVLADAGQTNGITYPQGFFVLHFHASSGGLNDASQIIVTLSYNDDSESVIPASDIEPLYFNAEDYRNVWKVNLASTKNYLQKIKLDIKGGSRTGGNTSLVEVEYYQQRIGQTGLDFSGFTKYTSNVMYNDLDFKNSSNTEVASITNAGVGTFATVAATTLAVGGTTITATGTELNYTDGVTSAIQTQLNAKSSIHSPSFTGTPAGPTATANTNNTQFATTAFVSTAVANLVDSAPGTLDTLNELAAALGDDASFSTTITNSIATKAPIADPTFTGEIGIGSVNVSEAELGILEGATLTTTELNYVDGVTSAIQTQLDAKAPSTGIATAALASDCIIPAKIATSVAGDGLAGGGGSALSVNVDDSTIDISSDQVRVKPTGVLTVGGLTVDTDTLHVDTTNNRVGIGTTSPVANLTIEGDHDGGTVSLRMGANGDVSNYSSRLEMAEDCNGSRVMTYGSYFDYDGDAVSPDFGMLKIGMRDNSTSDTDVVKISRKADKNALVLGDTTITLSASSDVYLTSSGGSIHMNAPGNDVNVDGTLVMQGSNDLDANTATFSGTVTMTGDLNADSGTLFVDASDNDIRIGTTSAVSTEKVLVRQATRGLNTGIMLSKGTSTGDEYLALDISEADVAMITAGAYGTGDCALAFRTSDSSEAEVMRLSKEGRLGIGKSNPSAPLDVVGEIVASTGITSNGTLHSDGNLSVDGTNNSIAGKLVINAGGGSTTSPSYDDGLALLTHNDYWYVYPKRISSSTTNVNLQFNADGTDYGFIDDGGSNDQMNFTGQHRCLADSSTDFATLSASVGKIVIASGQYDNPNTTDGVTINETIPTIKLSSARNQKAAFGVVSNSEDPNQEDRTYNFGAFGTNRQKKGSADVRLHINSLGEGGIWISNINGNLENGDYITTCEVPGYGMKQDDDLLHNYTVAKITQDCDFDLNSVTYKCVEIQYSGIIYRAAFVGCTYHCG